MVATHTIKHNGVLYVAGEEIPMDEPKANEVVQKANTETVKRGRTRKTKVVDGE